MNFGKLTHFDSVNVKGTWWPAGLARRKRSGTLHINCTEKINLEVDGVFTRHHPFAPSLLFGPTNEETIFGETDDGIPVSLLKCFWTQHDGARTTYLANMALTGVHVRALSAVKFQSFFLSFTGLDAWAAQSPFRHEQASDDTWTVSYTDPPDLKVTVPQRRLSLYLRCAGSTEARPTAVTMAFGNSVWVEPETPVSWRAFDELSGDILGLFTVLIGSPAITRQVGGVMKVHQRRPTTKASSRTRNGMVHVFRPHVKGFEVEEFSTPELLFPRPVLGERFEAVCRDWFKTTKVLRGMYRVLFSEMRTRSRYLEPRFFHFAQCLESLHRKAISRGGGKHLPKRRFKSWLRRVDGSLPKRMPKGMADAIRRVLPQANEFSFQDRLRSLFELLETDTASHITTDVGRFVQAIRDTRNLFTHLEPRKKSFAFPKHQWFAAIDKMQMLLLIHILKLCGLPEAEIRERMRGLPRFRTPPL